MTGWNKQGERTVRCRWILLGVVFSCLLLCAAGPSFPAEVASIGRDQGLPNPWITALAEDDRGVWAGTMGGGVALLSAEGKVLRVFGVKEGLPSGNVTSLGAFQGKIYVGTDSGIGVFDGNAWLKVNEISRVRLRNVYLRPEPDGKALWVGAVDTAGGLFRYDGKKWEDIGGGGRGQLNHIRGFAFQEGVAWLGSAMGGVYRKRGAEFRAFRTKDGLPSSSISSLEIFGGALWAGTASGAARFDGTRWEPFTEKEGFPIVAVYCMAGTPDALYLGGREGVVKYDSKRFEGPPGKDLPRGGVGRVNALLYARDRLFVGTTEGLLIVKGW